MCRSCGAIIGGGESQCAVCGATVTGMVAAERSRSSADSETLRFARAVLSRPYKFTIVLLIANFFVFLLMWQSSGMTAQAMWVLPEPVLIAYGAKLNHLIHDQHQWWRFVTPMFIHVGILHLLVNMYSLWIIGPYVEKLYGPAKFVVFWVLTGIAGVVGSYLTVINTGAPLGPLARFLFKTQDSPSAGASGALFGLVGVLFVFGIKFRHELPEGFKRAFGTGMLPVILLNLFIGYMAHGFIDNAAHVGGLISGSALALVVGYSRPGDRTQASSEAAAPFLVYAKAMNDAQEVFFLAINKQDTSAIDLAVSNIEAVPSLDPKADELKERLKLLLLKTKQLPPGEVKASEGAAKSTGQRRELAAEFSAWSKEYTQWLKTTAKQHAGRSE